MAAPGRDRSPGSAQNAGAIAFAAILIASGCGDGSQPITTVTVPTTTSTATVTVEPNATQTPDKPTGPAEDAEQDPRLTADERAAISTAREYIEALDARDGARVCALLAAGAIDEVELPRARGDCAASLTASIGYRDPRGFPVWAGATDREARSIEVDGEGARVVLTVVDSFADRGQRSIEDDVIYLTRSDGGWLIAKPSTTLYRAIGVGDIPPSVLAPPG